MFVKATLVSILIIIYVFIETDSSFEFTNVKCNSYEKQVGEFEYCYLKSINRSYKYISIKFQLYEVPQSNITINFIMWKRFNGYKPFLYNITANICKFMASPKSSPVANFIFESIREYSNINHSCPYNNDMIVEKLPVEFLNHQMTHILPFPKGDYLFEFLWIHPRSVITSIRVYFTLS